MHKETLPPLQNGIEVHALSNIISFAAKQSTDKLEQYMADVLYGRRQCEKRSRRSRVNLVVLGKIVPKLLRLQCLFKGTQSNKFHSYWLIVGLQNVG